jgi:hypothetical protein
MSMTMIAWTWIEQDSCLIWKRTGEVNLSLVSQSCGHWSVLHYYLILLILWCFSTCSVHAIIVIDMFLTQTTTIQILNMILTTETNFSRNTSHGDCDWCQIIYKGFTEWKWKKVQLLWEGQSQNCITCGQRYTWKKCGTLKICISVQKFA